MVDNKWKEAGYVDEPVPAGTDIKKEIRRMAQEKKAVIMAHYYTEPEVQDIADFVGDSLALAQQAAKTDADIIVMCGVHFMGETNKILCPDKKVLVPDLNATCSLAESCPAQEFGEFVKAHPGHTVISYVNTTAAIKALTDIVVTSGNALKIVNSLPKDEKIIFGPLIPISRYWPQPQPGQLHQFPHGPSDGALGRSLPRTREVQPGAHSGAESTAPRCQDTGAPRVQGTCRQGG